MPRRREKGTKAPPGDPISAPNKDPPSGSLSQDSEKHAIADNREPEQDKQSLQGDEEDDAKIDLDKEASDAMMEQWPSFPLMFRKEGRPRMMVEAFKGRWDTMKRDPRLAARIKTRVAGTMTADYPFALRSARYLAMFIGDYIWNMAGGPAMEPKTGVAAREAAWEITGRLVLKHRDLRHLPSILPSEPVRRAYIAWYFEDPLAIIRGDRDETAMVHRTAAWEQLRKHWEDVMHNKYVSDYELILQNGAELANKASANKLKARYNTIITAADAYCRFAQQCCLKTNHDLFDKHQQKKLLQWWTFYAANDKLRKKELMLPSTPTASASPTPSRSGAESVFPLAETRTTLFTQQGRWMTQELAEAVAAHINKAAEEVQASPSVCLEECEVIRHVISSCEKAHRAKADGESSWVDELPDPASFVATRILLRGIPQAAGQLTLEMGVGGVWLDSHGSIGYKRYREKYPLDKVCRYEDGRQEKRKRDDGDEGARPKKRNTTSRHRWVAKEISSLDAVIRDTADMREAHIESLDTLLGNIKDTEALAEIMRSVKGLCPETSAKIYERIEELYPD